MYRVQFLGLVCFFTQPDGKRLVLLPDGTHMVPQHKARIAVDPKSVVPGSASGNWPPDKAKQGDFMLDEDFDIVIEQADQSGTLDVSNHKLNRLPAGFTIAPASAKTIGRIAILQGTLQSFRYPGTNDTPDASTISQLEVQHEGTINITATSRNGSGVVRMLKLAAGTEIAIVNDASDRSHDHFHMYGQLGQGAALGTTPDTPPKLHRSQSHHRVFLKPDPIVDGVRCPNTGCC